MKKLIIAFGFVAMVLGGTTFAQNSTQLEELINMKMTHLETLEEKISNETLLTSQYKQECLQEIEMQRAFYRNELTTIDRTTLQKLQNFSRVHDKKNKECIDFALQKRLEMIRQKQNRLKNRWFGWFYN